MQPSQSRIHVIICILSAVVASAAFLIGLGVGVITCLIDKSYTSALLILLFMPVVFAALILSFRRYAYQITFNVVIDSKINMISMLTLLREETFRFDEIYDVKKFGNRFRVGFILNRKKKVFFVSDTVLTNYANVFLEAIAYKCFVQDLNSVNKS